jgi:hypothetical protein
MGHFPPAATLLNTRGFPPIFGPKTAAWVVRLRKPESALRSPEIACASGHLALAGPKVTIQCRIGAAFDVAASIIASKRGASLRAG